MKNQICAISQIDKLHLLTYNDDVEGKGVFRGTGGRLLFIMSQNKNETGND